MRFDLQSRYGLTCYLEKVRSLPDVLREELLSWERVYKSPHSRSFYNMQGKTWDHTPEGCLRISNHWNFKSRRRRKLGQATLHCQTDVRVRNNNHWTLARYEGGIWKVLRTEPVFKKSGRE